MGLGFQANQAVPPAKCGRGAEVKMKRCSRCGTRFPAIVCLLASPGWYLLVPPGSTRLPLADWLQLKAYDSAAQCQHDRHELMKLPAPPGTTRQQYRDEVRSSRCIASDDPRLKEGT